MTERSDNVLDVPIDVSQYPMGVAYKKPGSKDLWRRVGNTEINITKLEKQAKNMQLRPGTYRVPTYSFSTSTNSGVFMPNSKSVGVSVNGLERLRIGNNATRLMNVLEFTNTSTGQPTEDGIGKLFKKPGSDGLWWSTSNGLVDLTAVTSVLPANNGNATNPNYSFGDNSTSGMFLKAPGHIGLSVNGVERMSFKHAETVSVNPLRSATGTASIPSYSFTDRTTTGLYSAAVNRLSIANNGIETLRVTPSCIKVMSEAVLMHADGVERTPGLSFTNEPTSGLYRKANGVLALACLSNDVLVAEVNQVKVNGKLMVKSGGTTPTYGFINSNSGMRSDDDGNMLFTIKSDVMKIEEKLVSLYTPLSATSVLIGDGSITSTNSLTLSYDVPGIEITRESVLMKLPLKLESSDDSSGTLYKKSDSNGLYWNVNGIEHNLLAKETVDTSKGYLFDVNHSMTKNDDNLVLTSDQAVVSISNSGLNCNVPVVFEDNPVPVMSGNNSGALYKKPDELGLYWNVNNTEVDLTSIVYPLKAECTSVIKPTYSFKSHSGTGMYYDIKPGFSFNSVRVFDYNGDRVAFDKPLELSDVVVSAVNPGVGRLFKKAGSNGLFWKTETTLHDLTTITDFPMLGPNGQESNPTYAFDEDRHSGMYYSNGLVFSHQAFDRMTIDDNIHLHTDLHLHNNDMSGVLSVNGDKLTWTVNGTSTDFGGLSYPLQAPVGGISAPSYAFKSTGSGLYHDANGVCIGVNSILSTSFNSFGLTTSIIEIKDVDETMVNMRSNVLYKCMDSDDLWWSSNGVTKNLCDVTTEFPLYATSGHVSYSFAEAGDTGMRLVQTGKLSLTVNGTDMITVTDTAVTMDHLMINRMQLEPSSSAPSTLSHTNGKLIWTDLNGESFDLVKNMLNEPLTDTLVLANGDVSTPSLAFTGDTDTGLRLLMPNMMSYACGGEDRVLFTESGLRVKDTIGFMDTTATVSSNNNQLHVNIGNTRAMTVAEDSVQVFKLKMNDGVLHSVDNNLVWTVDNIDKCLNTDLEFPMLSPNGDADTPSYSFESDNTSGMYLSEAGLAFTYKGNLSALFGDSSVFSKKYNMSAMHSMSVVHDNIVIKSNDGKLTIGATTVASSFRADEYLIGSGGITATSDTTVLAADSLLCTSGVASVAINEAVVIDGPLTINGTDVSLAGKLTTNTNGVTRTYHASETFGVSVDVVAGDVVGIQNDGIGLISKVAGGKWSNEMKIATGDCSRVSLWDTLQSNDIRLYTYAHILDGKFELTLCVTVFNGNSIVGNMTLPLNTDFNMYNYTVCICKIDSGNYVVAFGDYNSATTITLKQFTVTVKEDVPKMLVMSELRHETTVIETFSLVYESVGSLDILVLTMYNAATNNIDVAMFSCLPHLQPGYTQQSILTGPLIGNNKTMRSMLLPAQTVVCSYGNNKCFLLLPSDANESFNVCSTIMDNNSSDCIDMIYDSVNSVILSVEQTYADQAFLQVSDIFGTKINIIRSKSLGRNTCVPIGLGYNSTTDNFVLFYTDSAVSGQMHAQIFTHDGESLTLGIVYDRVRTDNLVTTVDLPDGTPIPANGRHVFNRAGALCVEWESGSESSSIANFDDDFGIQATAYIGIAMNTAVSGDTCEVALRGQIFESDISLPVSYVGKRLYLNGMGLPYPNSVTVKASGRVFLGTCLTTNRILVGL